MSAPSRRLRAVATLAVALLIGASRPHDVAAQIPKADSTIAGVAPRDLKLSAAERQAYVGLYDVTMPSGEKETMRVTDENGVVSDSPNGPQATGRVHTTLNQAVTATGRLSSTNPNLQNIPIRKESGRRIRAAFVASPGYVLMSADYSQIELRIFAHLTGDPEMTDAFKHGEDIHARTARLVFGAKTKQEEAEARRLAKVVNFGVAYAVGAFGLAARTGLSRAEAKRTIDNYYETFKGVRRYMEEIPEQVRETGFVRTALGRIRPIPDINNKNHNLRARAERGVDGHDDAAERAYQHDQP